MRFNIISFILVFWAHIFVSKAQTTAGLPYAVLTDYAGRSVSTTSISNFDDPIILITYSQKWCPPCINLLDNIDIAYSQSSIKSNLKIIAICVDKGALASDVFSKNPRWKNIEILHDSKGDFMNTMYANSAPKIFFLDGNQQVLYCHESYNLDINAAFDLALRIKRKEICSGKVYYDENWFPTTEVNATFYRLISRDTDGLWDIRDYYKSGTMQMQGKAIIPYPIVKNGKFTFYHKNGNVSTESIYKNGKINGQYIEYNENGGKIIEYNQNNGVYHGNYTAWHPNGSVKNLGVYDNGNPVGVWYHYYPSGKKLKETQWVEGKREGKCTVWYENGKVKMEGVFSDDILDLSKKPLWYSEKGLSLFEIVSNNELISIQYKDENGNPYITIEGKSDVNQMEIYHYESGKLILKVSLTDPETVNGKLISWHTNGQKAYELTLWDNIPSGKAMAWWENGVVRERIDFDLNKYEYFDDSGKAIQNPMEIALNLKPKEAIDTKWLQPYFNYFEIQMKKEGGN